MNQSRLNIFSRKISAEEKAHARKIDTLKAEIREQSRIIDEKTAQFNQRKKHQQQFSVGFGEVQATDDRLTELIQPHRAHLKKCKQELIELTGQIETVQKTSAGQSDLFNS
jgi:transposase